MASNWRRRITGEDFRPHLGIGRIELNARLAHINNTRGRKRQLTKRGRKVGMAANDLRLFPGVIGTNKSWGAALTLSAQKQVNEYEKWTNLLYSHYSSPSNDAKKRNGAEGWPGEDT